MNHGTDPRPAWPAWRQVLIHFDNYPAAEEAGVAHIGPEMARAETEGVIASWFFMRKNPCWRLRFQPAHNSITTEATTFIHQRLDSLQDAGRIATWVETSYEPETYAFGGGAGMELAHHVFHADSRHILAYLATDRVGAAAQRDDQRREVSVLLCASLMRGAGQDWYEQGDIWARVAELRPAAAETSLTALSNLESGLRRLMTVDTSSTSPLMWQEGSLAFLSEWAASFSKAGQALGELALDGKLSRGVRAVLAHHVIFHWNRIGLPYPTQSVLANTAKSVILGRDERSPAR